MSTKVASTFVDFTVFEEHGKVEYVPRIARLLAAAFFVGAQGKKQIPRWRRRSGLLGMTKACVWRVHGGECEKNSVFGDENH
jgi:hypothetical protein